MDTTFFVGVTLIKSMNTPLDRSAAFTEHIAAALPSPARNLARAELGRISEKWADSGFARGEAEIRYNPKINHLRQKFNGSFAKIILFLNLQCFKKLIKLSYIDFTALTKYSFWP